MDQVYDVLIVGGGSAATSAAMTLRNRGKSIAVVTNKPETSSLYKAEKITNYPGLPPMTGAEMSVAGVDVPTAQLRETYTKTMRLSRITTAFKRKVARLVGKVNSGPFKGWEKGEVMFLGMSYSSPARRSSRVNVAFNFAIQPNEEESVCGRNVSKKGFEYAWGLSKTVVDENGVPKADVEAIYVDEVCRYDSFSALGL